MKYLIPFVILWVIAACGHREKCRFSTVADLDRLDLAECPPGDDYTHDTMYYHYIRKFSSQFNNIRREKGIPILPNDFQVITWSVNNQVRWRNAEAINKIDDNFHEPFMQRKDLEWRGDLLIYDYTTFSAMDTLDSWVDISYELDSLTGNYNFNYSYSDKRMPAGKDSILTKPQIDSILKAWKIDL